MTSQTGRARAEELLEHVELPRPFDVAEFCRRLAAYRRRRIQLCPERGAHHSGTLIGRPDVDEIHFSTETSEYHQWGIILHEVGHLLMGHGMGKVPKELLEGYWAPGTIRQLASRHQYDAEAERDVEDFATTILERVDEAAGVEETTGQATERERLRAMFMD